MVAAPPDADSALLAYLTMGIAALEAVFFMNLGNQRGMIAGARVSIIPSIQEGPTKRWSKTVSLPVTSSPALAT
jgi:hypothetical protein